MTRKDIIFFIILALYLISNFTFFKLFGDVGLIISDLFWITIIAVLISLKRKTKLGNWLETKIQL